MSRLTGTAARELAETFVKLASSMCKSAETFVKSASIVGKLAETSAKPKNNVRKLADTFVKRIKLTCESAQAFAESAGQSHTCMQHPHNDARNFMATRQCQLDWGG